MDGGGWHASSNNNASDDTSSPGANSLDNLTPGDELISLADGSENYHLKTNSNLIGAGKDLSGTFTTDLDGNDRQIPQDIGAFGIPFFAVYKRVNGLISSGINRRVD